MTSSLEEFARPPENWTRRHLLDLESLSADEINVVLDTAFRLKRATNGCRGQAADPARPHVRESFLRELHPHAQQLFAGCPPVRG